MDGGTGRNATVPYIVQCDTLFQLAAVTCDMHLTVSVCGDMSFSA